MKPASLTFACELEGPALESLFAGSDLVEQLLALDAGVSLGILDLGPERAAVVRRLNQAGVPVVAWQLLPRDQGYWYNLDNAPQAAARYAAFEAWSTEHGLRWAGIGVDVEPDVRDMELLVRRQIRSVLPRLLRRAFDLERVRRGQAAYNALLMQMRAGGYPVESYQFPFIVDERKAGSTLLQRLFGVVDLPTDREVLMLYSSFMPALGPGLLWSYGGDAGAVGVGSTGGGVEMEGGPLAPALTWEQLTRDLWLARRRCDHLFVFSLEGCRQQGFLERLRGLDWDEPVDVAVPWRAARQVEAWRRGLRALLWSSAHPVLVLGAFLALRHLLRRRS